jgi:hypothetical protein
LSRLFRSSVRCASNLFSSCSVAMRPQITDCCANDHWLLCKHHWLLCTQVLTAVQTSLTAVYTITDYCANITDYCVHDHWLLCKWSLTAVQTITDCYQYFLPHSLLNYVFSTK